MNRWLSFTRSWAGARPSSQSTYYFRGVCKPGNSWRPLIALLNLCIPTICNNGASRFISKRLPSDSLSRAATFLKSRAFFLARWVVLLACVSQSRRVSSKVLCVRWYSHSSVLPLSLRAPTLAQIDMANNGKMTYVYDQHVFHYIVEDGIVWVELCRY